VGGVGGGSTHFLIWLYSTALCLDCNTLEGECREEEYTILDLNESSCAKMELVLYVKKFIYRVFFMLIIFSTKQKVFLQYISLKVSLLNFVKTVGNIMLK